MLSGKSTGVTEAAGNAAPGVKNERAAGGFFVRTIPGTDNNRIA
jgi:hypothetical protein